MKKLGIGNTVRLLRIKQELTLVELAVRAELTQNYLCRIEKGERHPRLETTLGRIAFSLGISLAKLVEIAEEPIDDKSLKSIELINEIISILEGDKLVSAVAGLDKILENTVDN